MIYFLKSTVLLFLGKLFISGFVEAECTEEINLQKWTSPPVVRPRGVTETLSKSAHIQFHLMMVSLSRIKISRRWKFGANLRRSDKPPSCTSVDWRRLRYRSPATSSKHEGTASRGRSAHRPAGLTAPHGRNAPDQVRSRLWTARAAVPTLLRTANLDTSTKQLDALSLIYKTCVSPPIAGSTTPRARDYSQFNFRSHMAYLTTMSF